MAKGKKTGGRQKGSRNKRTEAQAAAIESSGLTPLEYMLSVMRCEVPNDAPLRDYIAAEVLRLDAAKAAAPYVHPKLANIELTGKDKGPLEVKIVRYTPAQPMGSPSLPAAAVDSP